MAVILAKYAGFCFGVQRAVSTVYDIIEKEKNSQNTLLMDVFQ